MEEGYLRDFIGKFQGDGEIYDKLYAALRSGDNKLFHNFVSEHFALDDKWIYTIEGALFSVELIARNPRRFIKEEEEIVDVERAKRTTAKTVRHLSSHTQNIQSVTSDNVRPKRCSSPRYRKISPYTKTALCIRLSTACPSLWNSVTAT